MDIVSPKEWTIVKTFPYTKEDMIRDLGKTAHVIRFLSEGSVTLVKLEGTKPFPPGIRQGEEGEAARTGVLPSQFAGTEIVMQFEAIPQCTCTAGVLISRADGRYF